MLFNHSAEDFMVQIGDRIAQLILEQIETPHVKKWQPLMILTVVQEDLGVPELSHSSSPLNENMKESKGKESSIRNTSFTIAASAELG